MTECECGRGELNERLWHSRRFFELVATREGIDSEIRDTIIRAFEDEEGGHDSDTDPGTEDKTKLS
jgi:hypothetical protein